MRSGPAGTIKKRRVRDSKLIAGIDLGASKVACFIAELPDSAAHAHEAEIIGIGCHGAHMRAGVAMSIDEMETGLRRAVDAAERMAGVRINKVSVAAPGRYIRARRIGVDLEIADGVVTEEDIEDCLEEGATLAASPDCSALQATPINYQIDAEADYDDPVGHYGSMLSTELLSLSVRNSLIDNLSALVERCGLTASDFVAAPVASAESCLIEDEKELGVVLIDIGAASTGFAVYDGGALIDCGGIGIGGGHITKDIAQIFGTPLGDAERIKILNGAALIGSGDEHRCIDFPQLGDAADINRASRGDLCEVIIPRMEEIFEMVGARLPGNQRGGASLRRAVITGGGSLLLGARESAEKMLGMKTRLGRSLSVLSAPEAGTAPAFSVCAGLVQHAAQGAYKKNFSLGVPGQSPHSLTRSALIGGVEAWLRAKF